MSAPFRNTPDTDRNFKKLLKFAHLKCVSEGKWRGDCPACEMDSFVVTRSLTGKILFACHHDTWSRPEVRDEHRMEIVHVLHEEGISLSDYVLPPATEMILAEYPFFVFDRKPDYRVRNWEYRNVKIKLIPSELGHPTIFDEPLYLLGVKLAKDEFSEKGIVPEWVEYRAKDYLEWICVRDVEMTRTNRDRIKNGLVRMAELQVVTTIVWGDGGKNVEGEGLIAKWRFGRPSGLDPGVIQIKLADWTRTHIATNRIIHLPADYFDLPPVGRKIYQILHKHLGHANNFQIGLENLRVKMGFSRELKKFRSEIRSNPVLSDLEIAFVDPGKIRVTRKKIKK